MIAQYKVEIGMDDIQGVSGGICRTFGECSLG
jgi:hypothetical protein